MPETKRDDLKALTETMRDAGEAIRDCSGEAASKACAKIILKALSKLEAVLAPAPQSSDLLGLAAQCLQINDPAIRLDPSWEADRAEFMLRYAELALPEELQASAPQPQDARELLDRIREIRPSYEGNFEYGDFMIDTSEEAILEIERHVAARLASRELEIFGHEAGMEPSMFQRAVAEAVKRLSAPAEKTVPMERALKALLDAHKRLSSGFGLPYEEDIAIQEYAERVLDGKVED